MTIPILSLSEEKLHQIFPNYFGTPSVTNPASSGSKVVGTGATDTGSISGWEGNDVITAGPAPSPSSSGSDRYAHFGAGDHGDDQLSGYPGNDVLVGGKGDNIISGGADDDYIYGDQLRLELSKDDPTVPPNATPSDPIKSSDDGNDLLYGGKGNDFIHGGGGVANFLRGGKGDDTLVGDGTKRDVLIGLDGDDYLIPGDATPFTAMEGGNGADVFDLTDKTSGDVRILDFTAGASAAVPPNGDKIKLPPSDSIAVLYKMVLDEKTRGAQKNMDWNWNWVATETDDGVEIPFDNGTLYLVGVEFADLTIDVSGGIFELTLT